MGKAIINYQYKWKEQEVSVEDLVLDMKNIRLEIEHESEKEIANDLFINENAFAILENIYENGFFSDESPVVVKENKRYIVLDGNRRIVSLKAMINPELAPDKYALKIKKLMEKHTPIRSVFVRVASSRDEAMQYLAAKHTKTTRKPWSALRRAYFYYAQKEQGQTIEELMARYKGVDIPSYIRMHEMHNVAMSLNNISEDVRKKVSKKNSFKISTFERVYSDKNIQEKIGIDFNKTTGEVKVPIGPSFDKVFSRVVSDIVAGVATSRKQLSREEDRGKYIDSIISETLDGKAVEVKIKKSASIFKPKAALKGKKKYLIPKTINSTLDSPGIARVMWELQNIDYKLFQNATADLLRTFLEKTLKKYLEQTKGLPKPRRSGGYIYLDDVLTKIHDDLKSASNHQFVQVISEIKKNKWYLESINHNPDVFAVDYRVEEAWDLLRPLVEFVFSEYEKQKQAK